MFQDIVAGDITAGKYGGLVRTRFPPEPNGHRETENG